MSYTVLARRYRSQTFDDVIGQEAVSRTLKNAIATDRVAHAYLFSGTRGVGKTTMARVLAKALNCLRADKPTPTPCCECEGCLAIAEGEDIDVLEIDGASNTGVENIRELRQNAIYKPARARFKIYIIDEVHMLSTSAFNALLKTLEEPPEHVKFILATTEPNKVLATIQSRCQRFDFRNIRIEDMVRQLNFILEKEAIVAEEILIRRVARLAHGSMRDALSLLDQIMSMASGKLTAAMLADLLGTPSFDRIFSLTEAMAQNNLAEALHQFDLAIGEGLSLEQITEALQTHFRDLMILRNCGAESELVEIDDPALREKMMVKAKGFDDATLVYFITVTEELRRALKSAGAGRPLVEAALVRMTSCERFSDIQTLLDQLGNLSDKNAAPRQATPATRSVVPAPTTASTPTPASPVSTTPTATAVPTAKIAPAPSAFPVPAVVNLAYFQGHWNDLAGEITRRQAEHLVNYVKPAIPTAYDQGQLTISYPPAQKGMNDYLQAQSGPLAELAEMLSTILKTKIKIALGPMLLSNPDPAPEATPEPAPAKRHVSPGAKPSQQEINDALNDPKVKQVQDILGGKVKQVERMTKPLF